MSTAPIPEDRDVARRMAALLVDADAEARLQAGRELHLRLVRLMRSRAAAESEAEVRLAAERVAGWMATTVKSLEAVERIGLTTENALDLVRWSAPEAEAPVMAAHDSLLAAASALEDAMDECQERIWLCLPRAERARRIADVRARLDRQTATVNADPGRASLQQRGDLARLASLLSRWERDGRDASADPGGASSRPGQAEAT